jgi:hypothetical protein
MAPSITQAWAWVSEMDDLTRGQRAHGFIVCKLYRVVCREELRAYLTAADDEAARLFEAFAWRLRSVEELREAQQAGLPVW